jgi:LmbE family N-acetylglucosaminyl deacetylase
MATAVFFHAHPDDECALTGGAMAKLADRGHRVVLITATRGEHGEVVPGVLAEGEALGDRRTQELEAAASVFGVDRLEILGYTDSGMMGTPENDAPGSFWQADPDQAAARVAAILAEEAASVFVIYDDHGGYGHPDHIQVHRVGVRAGALAGTPAVYEATMDRDRLIRLMRDSAGAEGMPDALPDPSEVEFGVSGESITTRVDVTGYTEAKRRAMRCHRTQIADDSFWLAMPEQYFRVGFGVEDYIRRDAPPGTVETELDLAG